MINKGRVKEYLGALIDEMYEKEEQPVGDVINSLCYTITHRALREFLASMSDPYWPISVTVDKSKDVAYVWDVHEELICTIDEEFISLESYSFLLNEVYTEHWDEVLMHYRGY